MIFALFFSIGLNVIYFVLKNKFKKKYNNILKDFGQLKTDIERADGQANYWRNVFIKTNKELNALRATHGEK